MTGENDLRTGRELEAPLTIEIDVLIYENGDFQ